MLKSIQASYKLHHVMRRMYSIESFKYIDLHNTNAGYSIMEMKRNPVNSFSLEFNNEIVKAIDTLENDGSCRGVIITSKLAVFSAGLDLMELYQPKPERLGEFWSSFQDVKLKLFSSPLVMIAAINGACPAGGCAIALSSDYRIFADGKHTIGLNEVLLGLAAPWWLAESFKLVVGHRQTEKLLALGTLLNPSEALQLGLVDAVVSKNELMNTAEEEMKKWLKIADVGRIQTKQLLRRKYIQEFEERRQEDTDTFVNGIRQTNVQKILGKYMESLQKKK